MGLGNTRLAGKLLLSQLGQFDLFGRVRVASARSQFTYQNEYNEGDVQWGEALTGTATAAHDATDATVDLTVAAEDDKVIRQTRKYMRYFSGKELTAILTWYTGAMPANVAFRAGYFDGDNGVYFERTSAGEFLCLRSGGVDTKVARANWNGSKFNSYNFDKSTIFRVSLQWLGVGNVQCGFEETDGTITGAHVFQNVGKVESTYMRTANLPIRYEVEATGAITADYTAKQICSAVTYEDGGCDGLSAYEHAAANGITAVAVTTRRCVLAVRPKLLLGGITNRADAIIRSVDLVAASNDAYWELVYNPTFAGTPTWTSVNDNSSLEYSVDATTITDGITVKSGFVISGGGQTRNIIGREIASNYPMALDIAGANPIAYAVICTSFTGTSNVNAAVELREIY